MRQVENGELVTTKRISNPRSFHLGPRDLESIDVGLNDIIEVRVKVIEKFKKED